jgi:hypothetical protein
MGHTHTHTHTLSLSLSFLVFWWCSFLDGFNKAFNVVFFFRVYKKSAHKRFALLRQERVHIFFLNEIFN